MVGSLKLFIGVGILSILLSTSKVNAQACTGSGFAVSSQMTPVICKNDSDGTIFIRINPLDTIPTDYEIFIGSGSATVPTPSTDIPGTFEATFTGLSAGFYPFLISNDNNCDTTFVVEVTEPDEPFALQVDSIRNALCGDNGYIAVSTTGGWSTPTVFEWNGTDEMGAQLPGFPTSFGFQLTQLVGGNYTIATTDLLGCPTTGSATIIGRPENFELTLSPAVDPVINLGESVDLSASVNFGTNISYTWFPPDYLTINTSSGDSVTSTPCENVDYIVLAIDNDNQCSDADSISVFLTGSFEPFVPNVFRPASNDPRNNEFQAFGIGIENVDMQIFDRKGAMIYESADSTIAKWNGLLGGDGNPAVAGKYIYEMRIRSVCDDVRTKSGGISLLR